MPLREAIAIATGVFGGIITGLVPGLHFNLLAAFLAGATLYLGTDPLISSIAIFSMAVAHTFTNIIPTVFLGAPSSETIAALPGHEMLKKGLGYEAVRLATIGGLFSLFLSVASLPIIKILLPKTYLFLKPYIGYILLGIGIFLVGREKGIKKLYALMVLALSGALGLLVLNSNISEPLLPLLSGLFGVPSVLLSLAEKTEIQKQVFTSKSLFSLKHLISVPASLIAAFSIVLFPSLSPAQGAVLVQGLSSWSRQSWLVLTGGIDTADIVLSTAAYESLGRARNGAIVQISNLLGGAPLLFSAGVALAAGGAASLATLYLAKKAANRVPEIPYSILGLFAISTITFLTLLLSGWIGGLVLIVASSIGMLAPLLGVSRSHAMGVLFIPVLSWHL